MEHTDTLEDIFQPYGQFPRDDLINHLWTKLLSHVEEAWVAQERLPHACLPGAMACPPPLDDVALARMNRNSLRRYCLRLLPLLASPALGRWTLGDIAGSQAPPAKLYQLSPAAPVFMHTYPKGGLRHIGMV